MSLLLIALALAAGPTTAQELPRAANPDATTKSPASVEMGELEVEAMQPAEVLLDGVKLGQLWFPGEVAFKVPAGDHLLRVYMQGKPNDLSIRVPADGEVRVLAGRTGLSATSDVDDEGVAASVQVEFRVMDARGATLRLDDQRLKVQAGSPLSLELDAGPHVLSVRSSDGTVIWASGVLTVSGAAPVVVHVTEGRLPEVSGGARFHTGNEG